MVKKFLSIILCAALFVSLPVMFLQKSKAATSMAGSGTAADPYIVTTATQLASIPSTGLGLYYQLGNDIDLSSFGSWNPIGDGTHPFTGVLDGGSHKITGLKMGTYGSPDTTHEYTGLFGDISNATIENINLSVEIYSRYTDDNDVGGLAGVSIHGNVVNSSLAGSITSFSNYNVSGGAVGYSSNSTYSEFYSTAQFSCSSGNLNSRIGGLIGQSSSDTITGCYASGSTMGVDTIGGLIGYSTVTNSYCTGTVGGSSAYMGGLVGYNDGTLQSCYASASMPGSSGEGGITGINYGGVNNCFWNKQDITQGEGSSTSNFDADGLTLATMQTQSLSNSLNTGNTSGPLWVYVPGINNNLPVINGVGVGAGALPTLSGDGTQGNPYIITTATQLASIPFISSSASYILGNDIDLSAYTDWLPIDNGTTPFTGKFDGKNYEVTGMTIGSLSFPDTSQLSEGLFGAISGASIKDVGVEGNIWTTENNIGVLVGYSSNSTVVGCYSKGSVYDNTPASVGGLIGYATGGTVDRSYSTVNISGITGNPINSGGGLIGQGQTVTVTNSYATGNVTAVNAGGLVGYFPYNSKDSIMNCYATGNATTTATGGTAGGLVGDSSEYDQFTNCYAAGTASILSGSGAVGGFIGSAADSITSSNYWNRSAISVGIGTRDTGTYAEVGLLYSDMQAQTFADTLNSNITILNLSGCVQWLRIPSKNNGLPVLSGVGDGADTTPPTGSDTLSKSTWTSNNVTITVTATDDASGVATITTPDGTVVNGYTVSYTATDNGTFNFVLTDYAGNSCTYPVTVSNIDRTVSVTHPVSVSYTINPNTGKITAPPITITNNSQHIGVSVTLQALKSTGMNDVSPTKYANWNALTAAQTASDIAFSIGVKEQTPAAGGWASITNSTPIYAANLTGPVQLGMLGVGGTGNLVIDAKYGLAWRYASSVTQNLTLIFNPCDVN